MRLVIVQHGEALSEQENPERPLSPQGEYDIQQLCARLRSLQMAFERVLHSGKLRAEQTAEILSQASTTPARLDVSTHLKPNGDIEHFIGGLAENGTTWLLASHMPFVSRLCSRLLGVDEEKPTIHFTPGTAACLQRSSDGHWQLEWVIPPGLME